MPHIKENRQTIQHPKKTVCNRDFGCNIKVFGLYEATIAATLVTFTCNFFQCQRIRQNHDGDHYLKP
ncbi:hypothetical protein GYH30_009686 [Glycine max]|uniref:Uncharacterized protein n=1 Tax=Glycine max TaxID=3847 RepID=A0A0R0KEP3_SOYBN|nr:hypothetical protein GYH30_009686 [Glycine max]